MTVTPAGAVREVLKKIDLCTFYVAKYSVQKFGTSLKKSNERCLIHDSAASKWIYWRPFFNVFSVVSDEEGVQKEIQRIKREFLPYKGPSSWQVGPTSTPTTIGSKLEQAEYVVKTRWTGMSLPLATGGINAKQVVDLEITRVSSEDQLTVWEGIVREGGLEDVSGLHPLHSKVAVPPNSALQLFIGCTGDKPAASAAVFRDGSYLSIFMVATLPEFRKQGIGSAMTNEAIRLGRSLGCKTAVLQSTPEAVRMYQELGFEKQCEITNYVIPTSA